MVTRAAERSSIGVHRIIGHVTLAATILLIPLVASAQAPAAGETDVTFTRDVVPILQRSCQVCHRQGEMAPMSLVTYQEVRPWARAIKSKVVNRLMPPWHIDKTIGIQKFKNDSSLSDAEIATIATWVDSGAPMGDAADMPPAAEFANASAWQIGEPDLVVRYPDYLVPAEGADLFGSLYSESPLDLDEPRYIKAIQTRTVDGPSRRVVHHALSFAVDPNEEVMRESGDRGAEAAHFLVEYASGKSAEIFPEDSGVLIEPGRRLRMDYHLHSVGEDIPAKVELGFVFYPKGDEPKYRRWSKQLGQHVSDLDIPPGKVVRTDGYTYFHNAARITAYQPHMHALGTYQCLELIYPSAGTPAKTEIVNCAYWDYNWHMIYNYEDDVAPIVPAGTVAHVLSWHDNTAGNRANHDASNWVGNGGRTIDEMGFSWLGWYDLSTEEYAAQLAERKSLQEAAASASNDE